MRLLQSIRTVAREAEMFLGTGRYLRNINGAIVVTYHGVEPRESINDPGIQSLHIDPASLKKQLEFIARHFEVVGGIDDVSAGDHRPAALITFDDGYRNFLTHALPVLEEVGVPATLFVTTNCIEHGTRHPSYICKATVANLEPGKYKLDSIGQTLKITAGSRMSTAAVLAERMKHLPWDRAQLLISELESLFSPDALRAIHDRYSSDTPLTWDEVRAVRDRGITVGSHTLDHVVLGPEQPDEIIRAQVVESRRMVEAQLGECRLFAYPNGMAADVCPAAVKAVSEAGYDYAFTTVPGVVQPDRIDLNRLALPRLSVSDSWSGFRKYISTAWRHTPRHQAFARALNGAGS